MLLQFNFYLLPAKTGVGDYEMPSVQGGWGCMGVHACLHLSHLYINLYISFIYEYIFTEFAENVYGYENMSVKKFVLILKNNMAAIANCSKIIDIF